VGPGTAVYVCDTIGELGLFYRLAGVVFVGKSFAGGGGQNPIEPARLACAILHGPMVRNFSDAYAALDSAGGALAIARPEDLGETLIALFASAARLRAMARSAGDTVERRAGAVERSMRALKPLLPVAGAAR
jgi:3-deoxy-D-manno-octulosonic-acid transferase